MSYMQLDLDRNEHPVDIIERIAALNRWSFDRNRQDEISILVAGGWTHYSVAFTWLAEVEAVHVACAFDLKISDSRRVELAALVSLINEEVWIGHFDLWPNDGVVMFRHAILLAGGAELNSQQCQSALASVVRACERYYQAFQFVAWAGKTGQEALATFMLETQGHA
ncbi:MAG: YbjN domain-containing protein [Beijerinckiaceae bacterium]|nr:YbjN domain-containing protein [Beijerinckiaceae bacterium]